MKATPNKTALFAGLLVLTLSSATSATTVIALSMEALVANADCAFEGLVEETSSAWENGLIVTTATVSVSDCYLGACEETMEIRQPGGEINGIMMEVAGSHALNPGDEIVLFGRQINNQGALSPLGAAQGIFEIDGPFLHRDLTEVILLSEEGPIESISGVPATLEELRLMVRQGFNESGR